jgi:hypothetical protein
MDNIIKVRVPEYSTNCGAAYECECILRALGYGYVKVYGTRGSHTAEVYISKEDRERFRNELLNKTVQGVSSRKFFFAKYIYSTLGEITRKFIVNYIR